MYVRKVLLVSKLTLALLLCYVVVKAVIVPLQPGEIFAPSSAVGTEDKGAVKTTSPEDISVKDYSAIIAHNIFASAGSSPTTSRSLGGNRTAGLLQSAEQELDLLLLGTICGSEAVSRAVIKDIKSDESDLYRTGDSVADACLEGIEKDTVVLLHNGQRKMLRLGTQQHDSRGKSPQVPLRQVAKQIGEAARTNLPVKQTPGEVRTQAGHIETMLRKAVIEPYAAGGQMEGLRITGLENIPVAKELGLKNGDVIRSVNGQRLTSKQKALQVFMKARTQAAINIELSREGKSKRLSFVLR